MSFAVVKKCFEAGLSSWLPLLLYSIEQSMYNSTYNSAGGHRQSQVTLALSLCVQVYFESSPGCTVQRTRSLYSNTTRPKKWAMWCHFLMYICIYVICGCGTSVCSAQNVCSFPSGRLQLPVMAYHVTRRKNVSFPCHVPYIYSYTDYDRWYYKIKNCCYHWSILMLSFYKGVFLQKQTTLPHSRWSSHS